MSNTRTEILIGKEGIEKLKNSVVAIYGIGGVGGYALEGIVRAGVGKVYLVDYDKIDLSNLNRQLISLFSTLNSYKIDVAISRAKDINPEVNIVGIKKRIIPENISSVVPEDINYAIDAIDEIHPKISLIKELKDRNITFVSSMGAGNRLDPSKIKIDDISNTSYCPLARSVRNKLKKIGIDKGVKSIYSTEVPVATTGDKIGSISYMPGIFGLIASGEIINSILKSE